MKRSQYDSVPTCSVPGRWFHGSHSRATLDSVSNGVSALLTPLGLEPNVTVSKNSVTITTAATLPQPVMDMLQQKITTLTKLTTVSFEAGKK